MIAFIKARKELASKEDLHDKQLLEFVRVKDAKENDPVIVLTDYTSYSVPAYMHYIMNSDIHIYEQQAYRFAKGDFADYMALLRDTVGLISEEEINEIKIPQKEGENVRHSSRITTQKHQPNYRMLFTRASDPVYRKPTYSPQVQSVPRKRSHAEISQPVVNTPTLSCDRFWKIVESSYYRPLPRSAIVPNAINVFREPVAMVLSRDHADSTLFSWINPIVPTFAADSHTREIK